MKENIILMADSYKYSHYEQYPENTSYIHSYLEARGSSINLNYTKFFGLSYYIQKYLLTPIDLDMINEAEDILKMHGVSFNKEGFMYILKEHDGFFPIKIRAVKEGTKVAIKNVLMTIESTDSKCCWIVGFVETLLLKVWYPTTVATISNDFKDILLEYVDQTSDNDIIDFMLHDFGFRGVSSQESAMIGSMAHLVNFKGSDTIIAIKGHREYYDESMAGFSIPATEHSTMTPYGKNEKEAFLKMINLYKDNYSVYSIVADSYDYFNAVDIFCSLKDEIVSTSAKLVIRPDSGDSVKNILYTLDKFKTVFGYTTNSKGYIVVNNVGVIQGDGVNKKDIVNIIEVLKLNNYAADNITFGMGGSLLQGNLNSDLNRDTFKFAIKTSFMIIDSKGVDIVKNPITDRSKASKKGRLDLIKTDKYETITIDENYHENSILELYYCNGVQYYKPSLKQVRGNDGS